jgi:MoxR-like ATPase
MSDWYTFNRYDNGEAPGDPYIPSEDLATAVNTALAAEQPLVVTGDPGTGKTQLAASIALRLGWGEVLKFVVRSDHQARDCQYTFDSLLRLYDAQVREAKAQEPKNYRRWQALGEAFRSPGPRVVLIDEIDKAPRDFPNDLLGILEEKLEFEVRETGETVTAEHRPLVVITSNGERQLPDAFLRRCVFHHIRFPDREQLERILARRRFDGGTLSAGLIKAALDRFEEIGRLRLEKRPAIAELLVWVRVLLRAGVTEQRVASEPLSKLHAGTLLKLRSDVEALLRAEAAKAAGGASGPPRSP